MFSVDTQTVYHTHKPSPAVLHFSTYGPCFTYALEFTSDVMNGKDNGYSTRNDTYYPVRPDAQGNDPLTGVKDIGKNYYNRFTVEELEVFTVKLV